MKCLLDDMRGSVGTVGPAPDNFSAGASGIALVPATVQPRLLQHCSRGQDFAAIFSKADARKSGPLAPTFHDYRIAIFQKATHFTIAQSDRCVACGSELDQGTGFGGRR